MAEVKMAGLAESLAGHDKGERYIIIRADGEYVYLSDGKRHPVDRPKRKNRKHLQLIDTHDETLERKLTEGMVVRNEEIIRFIRTHKQ